MSELSDNIEKMGPAHAILRGEIHFEILSLKILRKLLRLRGWSDLQTFGIKMTALILSFIAWSRIFKFPAWWRERAK